MKASTKVFFSALLISFLGTLPLGTLNVSITNLAINKGYAAATLFASGAILVEVAIVRIAMSAVGKLEKLHRYLKLFSGLSLLLLFSLAFITIIAAVERKSFEAALPFTNSNPFLSGMLLSVLNPLHLPFWLGWTAVFKSKGILKHCTSSYNIYMIAIGLGTSVAFWLFGFAGSYVIKALNNQQYLINWMVGISLLIAATMQLFKTIKKNKQSNNVMPQTILIKANKKLEKNNLDIIN